ncbi:MAG TPA: hypothetical protein VF783_14525 [Terriglobales bacterium]
MLSHVSCVTLSIIKALASLEVRFSTGAYYRYGGDYNNVSAAWQYFLAGQTEVARNWFK